MLIQSQILLQYHYYNLTSSYAIRNDRYSIFRTLIIKSNLKLAMSMYNGQAKPLYYVFLSLNFQYGAVPDKGMVAKC